MESEGEGGSRSSAGETEENGEEILSEEDEEVVEEEEEEEVVEERNPHKTRSRNNSSSNLAQDASIISSPYSTMSSPPPQLVATTSKRRSRRSSISAPSGGKPKFILSPTTAEDEDEDNNNDEDDDDDDDEDDDEAQEQQQPKKRTQTFGNSNTTSAADARKEERGPFKNLDVRLRLKVLVQDASTAMSTTTTTVKLKRSNTTLSTTSSFTADKKRFSIPAPMVATVSNPAAAVLKTTTPGSTTTTTTMTTTTAAKSVYLRFKEEWLAPHEYEITKEDEDWIQQAPLCCGSVSSHTFEHLINLFEEFTGTSSTIVLTSAKAFTSFAQPKGLSRPQSDELFQYWVTKRNKNKRSLVRKFWPKFTWDDKSLVATFRERSEVNRYKLRRKRMGDVESYDKLLCLKRDFVRLRDMIQLTEKRELLKVLEIDLMQAEYLEKVNPQVRPTCVDVSLPELSKLEPIEGGDGLLLPTRHRSKPTTPSSSMLLGSDPQQQVKKKSHKRKLQSGDEGYSGSSSHHASSSSHQPISLVGNPVPFYFPEALYFRNDPVPFPRYLLGNPYLIRENPYLPIKRERIMDISEVPLLQRAVGRNRRPVLRASDSAATAGTVAAFEPSPAVKQKLDSLFSQDRPGEREVIERLDVALLRANQGLPPKFQLLV